MFKQSSLSASNLKKLQKLRKKLPERKDEDDTFFEEVDENELRQDLLQQAEQQSVQQEVDVGFFDAFSGPTQDDGSKKLVEIEYLGRIGYVDISFDSIDDDVTKTEYVEILQSIEKMAFSDNMAERKRAATEIETFGDKAVSVIFREARKFDLTDEQRQNELALLIRKLAFRSYKGRKIIKAVLKEATSNRHITIALISAGAIREKEAVPDVLRHMQDKDNFITGLHTLLKIKDKNCVPELIRLINNIDMNRNDLIDEVIQLAPKFPQFGPDAVKPIFDAYMEREKKFVSPVYTIALRSFKEDAFPILSEVLDNENDPNNLFSICKALGSLKLSHATNLLLDTLEKQPHKQQAVIFGLSHTNDPAVLPTVVKTLKDSDDLRIKNECLNAIAYLNREKRNDELIDVVTPYLHEQRNKLYLDALYTLVRLGDQKSLEKYIELITAGDQEEQYVLQKYIVRMPFHIMTQIARRILILPDHQSILLITALQRANIMPKEMGKILREKLNQNPNPALKIEIFRLIGKHVGTKFQILPEAVLYKARQTETDTRVIRELDHIIKHMRKIGGEVSTS